ncbi:MAG: glycosyl transferase GT17 family protein [Lachnospiraceae bacterium]|nr:glycosyl transferase GT17 family protein [Lachnospiraceae bacterium]
MVIDCFPFFNELDILRLRLAVLDPLVDRFVIEESAETFSGEARELLFEKNRDLFARYLPKITYIPVTERITGVTTHERDYFQKNHLIKGLADAADDDILIFGDLDEIPDPETLSGILADFDAERVYHLAQDNFYAYLNVMEISGKLLSITGEFPEIPESDRKWLGTKVCAKKQIPSEGIVRLRDLVPPTDPRSVRVARGGWHFGYMGGLRETDVTKRIGVKVRAAAHQEYNDREVLRETMDHLLLGEDIFGRDARFARVEIDGRYPAALREQTDAWAHLILPPVTKAQRIAARLDLTAGRLVRRAIRKAGRMFSAGEDKRTA